MDFLVVQVIDGKLGQIKSRPTYDEAVDLAVAICAEQCDTPQDEIRQELVDDNSFLDPNMGWEVYLAQADAD